jgi:spermidine synthase
MLLVFALTLFASATLLFMVEPMIGKMILPLLGGTPAVWNTCMVFFQAILLLGYGYAHLSTTWLGARKQAALHLVLLLLPFLFLPVAVNRGLIKGDENPVFLVLLILSLSVGLPMFVVSASAPLLQKWFASTSHPAAKDPYFLYGASNLGSMLTLIAYPLVVEPNLRLAQQSFDWTIGYGVLVALTATCAVFLWLSPRNVEAVEKTEEAGIGNKSSEAIQPGRQGIRAGGRQRQRSEPAARADVALDHTLTGAVTWVRVLRWVALAFVPSSLMLGATTYITTDIAAIPLLWVAPLALYLLSFIIVFSRVPAWVHKAMVLILPLLILALLFFMLSEVKSRIGWRIGMHLTTLFVVSMVCHGELARDRPPPKYLTGYFLWMSVGGVLGGLFNGLVAPVIFTGIVEYELAMMLACYLTPPLGEVKESVWGRRADLILAGLFAGVAVLLIALRLHDHDLSFDALKDGPWQWQLAALALGVALAAAATWRTRGRKFDHWMDLVLPLFLGLLLIGLSWGLFSDIVWVRLAKIADAVNRRPHDLRRILTYGVPLVMCYTFVERSLRFALGVGAVLLASSFCGTLENSVLHQERSFFGVLKVENEADRVNSQVYLFRRLIHGTTLHGMQFLDEDRRDEPLTYYHITGPIGQVMQVYNKDNRRNLAVIGLGTGTMASYARPGQHLTFYDIDPVVRRLSFDEGDPYFTFVEDARRRGAQLELVMGDARLTMERKQLADVEKYGVIVVDAFSSDAIPIHLITQEALNVYLDKLAENGLLCFHISNRYLDLRPVLLNLARAHDPPLAAVYQSDNREENYPGKSSSTWVMLARKSEYLDGLRQLNEYEDLRKGALRELLPLMLWPDNGSGLAAQSYLLYGLFSQEILKHPSKWEELQPDETWPDLQKVGVWTDDYSNLLSVFSW